MVAGIYIFQIFSHASRAFLRKIGLFVYHEYVPMKNTVFVALDATALISAKEPAFYPQLLLFHQYKCQHDEMANHRTIIIIVLTSQTA